MEFALHRVNKSLLCRAAVGSWCVRCASSRAHILDAVRLPLIASPLPAPVSMGDGPFCAHSLGLDTFVGFGSGGSSRNSSSAARGEPPRPGAVPAGMEEGSSGEAQKPFIEAHKHCQSPAQPPGDGHRVDGQTQPAAPRAGAAPGDPRCGGQREPRGTGRRSWGNARFGWFSTTSHRLFQTVQPFL